jgi:hypothetical protein
MVLMIFLKFRIFRGRKSAFRVVGNPGRAKSHFSCWPIFNGEFSIQSNFNRTPFQWSITFITFINRNVCVTSMTQTSIAWLIQWWSWSSDHDQLASWDQSWASNALHCFVPIACTDSGQVFCVINYSKLPKIDPKSTQTRLKHRQVCLFWQWCVGATKPGRFWVTLLVPHGAVFPIFAINAQT